MVQLMSLAAIIASPSHASAGGERSPIDGALDREGDAWSAQGDNDDGGEPEGFNHRKRQRVSQSDSVSCEKCKERKVKCDRGRPSCGWCIKNTQTCEYRERKKPGLRAGYGRELEARLGKCRQLLQYSNRAAAQCPCHCASAQKTATGQLELAACEGAGAVARLIA